MPHIPMKSQLIGCLVSTHDLVKAVGQHYSRESVAVYHTPESVHASDYWHAGLFK